VAGPGVFICDGCVALAAQVIAGAQDSAPHVAPWERELPVDQILANLGSVAAAAEQAEASLAAWVNKARSSGATWSDIGQALGVTRQSAWERFARE
jgi:hypothetical protein